MGGGSSEPDLAINYEQIRELGIGLQVISGELERSESIASEYGEDVSHDDLASALESFADNWSDKRQEIIDGIQVIAQLAELAGDSFGGLDKDLADALEEEA